MSKILKTCQYKKFKIKVIDSDREKGIWAETKNIKMEICGYTDFYYTIDEAIDNAKEQIDDWLSKN